MSATSTAASLRQMLRADRPAGSPDAPTILFYWALFTGSAAAFVLAFAVGDHAPLLTAVLQFASAITCGFAWLLSRALFRVSPSHERWPLLVVGFLFLGVTVSKSARAAGLEDHGGFVLLGQGISLLSSAILIMTLLEAVEGARHTAARGERRFRLLFLGGYGALLFAGVLVAGSTGSGFTILGQENTVQSACALLAIAGGGAATFYRLAHPLTPQTAPRGRTETKGGEDTDPLVTSRLKALLEDGAIYRDPGTRIGSLASTLATPEYKVSQSVTRGLGFANVNQMLNSYRVEDAKARLSDPANDALPILTIALDSGFGSIGPFNRAFKAQVGMTPGSYRAQIKAGRDGA